MEDMGVVRAAASPVDAAKDMLVIVAGRAGGADMAVLATGQMAAYDSVKKISTYTHGASGLCTAEESEPGAIPGLSVQSMVLMCNEPEMPTTSSECSRVQLHNIAHASVSVSFRIPLPDEFQVWAIYNQSELCSSRCGL